MTTIKLRRGTAAQWTAANPVLSGGEPGYETDTGKHKIGDGAAEWADLEYFLPESAIAATIAAAVKVSDLVASAPAPLYFAHRDGGMRFPEECVEAVEAVLDAGFIAELDLRLLADGTVVACHDATTGRTMTGTDVNVSSLTLSQFKARRVKPVIPGGAEGTPIVLSEILDRFGHRGLWSTELKTYGNSLVDKALEIVRDRQLVGRVVWSSFDYEVCKRVVTDGQNAKSLTDTIPAATLAADGMKAACVSNGATDAYIKSVLAVGLRVYQWTITERDAALIAFAKGIAGVYTDEPWRTSRRFSAAVRVDLTSGTPGPFFNKGNTGPSTVNIDPVAGSLKFASTVSGAIASARLGEVGEGVTTGARIRWEARHLPGASSQDRWWGVFLGRFSTDSVYVTANGDLDGYLMLIRRDGREQSYKHPPNADSVEIGIQTRPDGTTIPADVNAASTWCEYELEFTATNLILTNIATGQVLDIAEDARIGGPSRRSDASLHFLNNGSSAEIRDIRITRPRV